jgi:hypothetical protein
MKVLHYPPQVGPVDDRVIGIGAHTELSWGSLKSSLPDLHTASHL